MSFNDVYEFIQGEYQQVTRIRQEPVSTADPTFFKDLNLVKWAGYSNEIWSAETGGTQLVQGLDYELQYLDVAASGPAGEPVYSGYSILTPLYYNIPLFQTANIVGAYTTRPYRPSYNVITADTTVTPASMDDSVIADGTSGGFAVTVADGFHLNQRFTVICKGPGPISIIGTGLISESYSGVGVSYLWDGLEWMPLATPGKVTSGIYYDWELVYENPGAPLTTIPDVSTYGEGLSYAAVEFTYGGEAVRASGTFAYYNDGIDRYTILANDVSGSDSTMNLRYDAGTDTLEALETGTDFTNINLLGLYHWTEYTNETVITGRIIQDEEINGQWVTRWDTGLMQILGTVDGTADITTASGALFITDATVIHNWAEHFAPGSKVRAQCNWQSSAGANMLAISLPNTSNTELHMQLYTTLSFTGRAYSVTFTATGRWK